LKGGLLLHDNVQKLSHLLNHKQCSVASPLQRRLQSGTNFRDFNHDGQTKRRVWRIWHF
jgi:hypothetical protein